MILPDPSVVSAPPLLIAYLDPGTGSIVVQLLLAAVFSALFFVKRIWHWIRSLLTRPPADDDRRRTPWEPPTSER